MPSCPICAGGTQWQFDKRGYGIYACRICGHRCAHSLGATHTSHIYGDDYFTGGGAGYADYLSEGPMLIRRGEWYGRLLRRHYGQTGTLLDVGAAAGFLVRGFHRAGWQASGLEPNQRMVDRALAEGIAMRAGALEDGPLSCSYDAISMIQVVPHFADIRRALHAASDATRQGGLWLVETWDRESWTARFAGENWHEYSPPSVLHWFSRAGLDQLAGQYGFRRVATGRPPKRIDGQHLRSLLTHALDGSVIKHAATFAARLIPNRLSLPYPGDDVFWTIYRKTS
jgi:hypothetical protein